VAAAAVVLALTQLNDGTPSRAATSPGPPVSTGAGSQATASVPVVVPKASSTSSFSYLSDLKPSGDLGELVNHGRVTISGSIYPKSISFYCNVGDATAFPAYRLKQNARRFQATLGLPATSPPQFQAGVLLIGDGRTLRTISVGVRNPKTVDVDVRGVHTLKLECFGSGNSATGGEAVLLAWGNARVSAGH
jgi:NPCBM/NEW2 domain